MKKIQKSQFNIFKSPLSRLTLRIAIIRKIAYAICVAPPMLAAYSASAATLTFPTAPLFLTAGVTPNIMLLVDNSGSMNNIIWDSAYNASTDYTDYSRSICGQNNDIKCWNSNDGNVSLVNLRKGACADNFIAGRSGRCLRLPDPVGGGNTRYNGNYLNYLFQTKVADNASADIRTTIPTDFRIQVARDVATSIVNANPTLRFGVAAFNPPVCTAVNNGRCVAVNNAPGGRIVSNCGTAKADVLTAIDNLRPEANTPLAETFYEITRYFRGLTSYFNSGVSYTTPIQYSCQKNFTIVVTDGFPTRDTQFPNNDPADPNGILPNWDGRNPTTTANQYPDFPQYSDGFAPNSTVNSANEGDEAATLLLDDLVKFGQDIDLSSTYTGKQSLDTYTVGFAVANQMLSDAAEYGTGSYFRASNKESLLAALQDAINDIVARTSSATAAALSASSVSTDTLLFQARFNSSDWSGDLAGIPISTGRTGSNCGNGSAAGAVCAAAWTAGAKLTNRNLTTAPRSIYTYKPSTRVGTTFTWNNLDSDQQNLLNLNPENPTAGIYSSDGNGSLRLSYLAGSRSNEASTATPRFRERNSLLGDIIGSDPFYVAAPTEAYDFDSYATFRRTNASRTKAVYVGSNDGMLHAFNAAADSTNGGTELFAYVPSKAYGTPAAAARAAVAATPTTPAVVAAPAITAAPKLALLTKLDYDTHIYAVDGAPVVGDAFINYTQSGGTKNWKSVLVGSLRTGGQGLYALDVTNPSAFDADKVMWEFTDRDDPDLGFTFSQASIVRMANGKWAAIVGNGYNNRDSDGHQSQDGKAALYIIYLDHVRGTAWTEGTDYIKLKTTAGTTTDPNGLATPSAVDVNGDDKIDYIYAGDQLGNMWRFNVRSATDSEWDDSGKITSLFQATSSSGAVQPITARPEVGYNLLQTARSTQGLTVYFGTGSYIATTDNSATGQATQSFYGIFDRTALRDATAAAAATPDTITRSVLQQQQITREVSSSGGGCTTTSCFRVTTQNNVNVSTQRGWYMDLVVGSSGNQGERQVTTPTLRNGRILFATSIPNSDACSAGGTSWLMEVEAKSGARLATTSIDTNNDGTFTDSDLINVTEGTGAGATTTQQAVGGIRSQGGMLSSTTILQLDSGKEVRYTQGDGQQDENQNCVGADCRKLSANKAASPGRSGRISWREITP